MAIYYFYVLRNYLREDNTVSSKAKSEILTQFAAHKPLGRLNV